MLLHNSEFGTLTWVQCAAGSVWLKQWSERNSEAGGNPDVGKYIGIYFAFGVGGAALVVVQTLILWIFCSIEVSSLQTTTFATVAPLRDWIGTSTP